MNDKHMRPMIFGEVLFDCFPDGNTVLGGAPFNVAWHLQAFGQQPLFISSVGDDELGQTIRERMSDFGMDTSGLQLDREHPTGTVQVSFENNEPSYDIVADRAYDFIGSDDLPQSENIALLYHGSLAMRNVVSRNALMTLKSLYPAPVFMDVNLRPPWWKREDLYSWMQDVTWLKLNQDELEQLVPDHDDMQGRVNTLLQDLKLQLMFVTRGEQGTVTYNHQANPIFSVRPAGTVDVIDTVGAGDAFSSILLLGQLLHWDLSHTLERAQSFASAIVGLRGATTQDSSFYQPFIEEWEMDIT